MPTILLTKTLCYVWHEVVFFFRDPLTAQPHEPDISALIRLADVHKIPIATNQSTAELLVTTFSPEELLARVRALSRRQGDVVLEEMRFADLVLNLSTYTLHCAARSVHLGFKEFEVLRLLMANPAVLVQKEDLLTRVCQVSFIVISLCLLFRWDEKGCKGIPWTAVVLMRLQAILVICPAHNLAIP